MSDFQERFGPDARELLNVNGVDLIERLGLDAVKQVVSGVLSGENVRQATETLTRRRIGLLNAAILVAFLGGRAESGAFPSELALDARKAIRTRGVSADDKKILMWALGLTAKQVQNVLRADEVMWDAYVEEFSADMDDIADEAEQLYGDLSGTLELSDDDAQADLDWRWALHVMCAVGAQTLATRGSEKSVYGKFFEKLILGGVLHVLGLRLVEEDDTSTDGVYWLSTRGKKRESDATALLGPGVGVRFDIGFIGPGNSEISLDKVSRFEREIEIGGKTHYMRTFIIVDRLGKRSRTVELAEKIEGTIIQMSSRYWPAELAVGLEEVSDGYQSPFEGMDDAQVHRFIEDQVETAPFEEILRTAAEAEEEESSDDEAVVGEDVDEVEDLY